MYSKNFNIHGVPSCSSSINAGHTGGSHANLGLGGNCLLYCIELVLKHHVRPHIPSRRTKVSNLVTIMVICLDHLFLAEWGGL